MRVGTHAGKCGEIGSGGRFLRLEVMSVLTVLSLLGAACGDDGGSATAPTGIDAEASGDADEPPLAEDLTESGTDQSVVCEQRVSFHGDPGPDTVGLSTPEEAIAEAAAPYGVPSLGSESGDNSTWNIHDDEGRLIGTIEIGPAPAGGFIAGDHDLCADVLEIHGEGDEMMPAEGPAVTTTTSEPVADPQWSKVAVFAGDDRHHSLRAMRSVTVGGPGLVAVGWTQEILPEEEQEGDPVAPVWTSTDGVRWSHVPYDEAAFGEALAINSVTAGGPGLVAVGLDDSGPAVWTSVDGISWSRVPYDEAAFGGEGTRWIEKVTAGGPGLVAVGWEVVNTVNGDQDAAVWTSVDGISWSRVPHDETVFGGDADQSMEGVTAGGPGLVAVGYSGESPEWANAASAVVWTSPDGVSWSRVADDDAVFGEAGMEGVTAGGPGLVAVGRDLSDRVSDGYVDAAVWTSVDGVTWSRVPRDEAIFGGQGGDVFGEQGDQVMLDVSITDTGLVAVGYSGPGDECACVTNAAVWTSADGIAWDRVADDDTIFGGDNGQFMSGVTTFGPLVVAVGDDFDAAAVWATSA